MGEKDIAEKLLEDYNDVFADIVNVLLFDGRDVIDPDDLENAQPISMYKADGKLHEQERDILKAYKGKNIQLAMIGLENQTKPEKLMPLRILSYDGSSYRAQMFDSKQVMPTVTLVLHFGTEHWNYGTSVYEVLDISDEWKPYVSDYRMNLFEIAFLSPETVQKFKSDFKIVADYFVQKRTNKMYIPSKETIKHVDEVLKLLSVLSGDDRFTEFDAAAISEIKGGVSMETLFDIKEQQGIQQGILKGEIKGKVDVYYYDMDLTPDEIADRLHISTSEVETIISQLDNEGT